MRDVAAIIASVELKQAMGIGHNHRCNGPLESDLLSGRMPRNRGARKAERKEPTGQ